MRAMSEFGRVEGQRWPPELCSFASNATVPGDVGGGVLRPCEFFTDLGRADAGELSGVPFDATAVAGTFLEPAERVRRSRRSWPWTTYR